MTGAVLCRLADIPDGGSAGFAVGEGAARRDLLAVRRRERVVVYVNVCPHWGAPLDMVPGRFLDAAREHILCATHGALFRFDDGRCIRGPCLGASLEPVPCRVEDGRVVLD